MHSEFSPFLETSTSQVGSPPVGQDAGPSDTFLLQAAGKRKRKRGSKGHTLAIS